MRGHVALRACSGRGSVESEFVASELEKEEVEERQETRGKGQGAEGEARRNK